MVRHPLQLLYQFTLANFTSTKVSSLYQVTAFIHHMVVANSVPCLQGSYRWASERARFCQVQSRDVETIRDATAALRETVGTSYLCGHSNLWLVLQTIQNEVGYDSAGLFPDQLRTFIGLPLSLSRRRCLRTLAIVDECSDGHRAAVSTARLPS